MTNSENKKWKTTVFKAPDSDDLMLELSADLLESVGWKIGDVINWELNKEGDGALLTKVSNSDD